MTPQEFVNRWRNITLKERSAAQSHFNDLCSLIGHPTPIEDDPTGRRFTFEAGANKQPGGQGWADVQPGLFYWRGSVTYRTLRPNPPAQLAIRIRHVSEGDWRPARSRHLPRLDAGGWRQ